ncbi:MAG: hypothetical protein ABI640_02470 [Gammaproteobacteria bacterium]
MKKSLRRAFSASGVFSRFASDRVAQLLCGYALIGFPQQSDDPSSEHRFFTSNLLRRG